jgi:signal transduction histidine kinase
VFRVERRARFFERRWVRLGLPALFVATTLLALILLRDIARERPTRNDIVVLGVIIVLLALTGVALVQVYRAYAETRDRLTYVKLYAYDILQSLSIGVITSDLQGTITNLNERARVLSDIGKDGAARPYREVLGHAPILVEYLDRLTQRGEEYGGQDVDFSVNGKSRTLRLDGHFLLADTGERIGAILQLQDVSHLKFLDQEMRRTEKLAGLGTLAAGIAHEIKNPLAALGINAQLLEEAVSQSPSGTKSSKYLGVILSEVRRLEGIVDKYVSFARPQSIERAPASLEQILEGILALVDPECRKRKISLVREGFSPSPARYLLDEGQIQQALLNLVINSIQAMEKGGTLTCRIGRAASFVTVEVADTGPGIAPEVRERMFDLFFTTRQGGTGLGLYITQRIVAEHKGYIDVKTGPTGTTFVVALPAEVTA